MPSGSELPEPSKLTEAPSLTVWSEPALAVGDWFGGLFTLSVVELLVALSDAALLLVPLIVKVCC